MTAALRALEVKIAEAKAPSRELSADIFSDATGRKWSAVIREHVAGASKIIWRRDGMASEHNAELAMEAAWNRALLAKETG